MKQKKPRPYGRGTRLCLRLFRLLDRLAELTALVAIVLLAAWEIYGAWDTRTVVEEAQAQEYEVYKPAAETESYAELCAINPDVCGWLTVYGTPIDYPLVQGPDNFSYLSTSVKLEYSLTGSLFLDYQNSRDFSDFNTVIYGHNMTPQVMFGSIRDFEDPDYFEEHAYGSLYHDGREYGLKIFSFFKAEASDSTVYNIGVEGEEERQAYLSYIESLTVNSRDVEVTPQDHILLLSTCSSESASGRKLLAALVTDEVYEDPFYEEEEEKEISRVDALKSVWERTPIEMWGLALAAVIILLLALIVRLMERRRRKKRHG